MQGEIKKIILIKVRISIATNNLSIVYQKIINSKV